MVRLETQRYVPQRLHDLAQFFLVQLGRRTHSPMMLNWLGCAQMGQSRGHRSTQDDPALVVAVLTTVVVAAVVVTTVVVAAVVAGVTDVSVTELEVDTGAAVVALLWQLGWQDSLQFFCAAGYHPHTDEGQPWLTQRPGRAKGLSLKKKRSTA